MHDRLVVGFDGSAASTAALEWASNEATTRGASVHVVSSYGMPPVMDVYGFGTANASPSDLEQLRQSSEGSLRAAVERERRCHPGVDYDFHAVSTQPQRALLIEAETADVLVVGSNGLGATKSFLLGSVLGAVLHRSPCPVAVVPPERHAATGSIVVGVDGSDASNVALAWAADEAARGGADLRIVHAWHYPYRVTTAGRSRGAVCAEADAAVVVEDAVEFARGRTTTAVVGELVEGSASQVLLDASSDADLIIVGPRGRGGFRAMLLGSVAQAVSVRAHCPVVVVRRDQGERERPDP